MKNGFVFGLFAGVFFVCNAGALCVAKQCNTGYWAGGASNIGGKTYFTTCNRCPSAFSNTGATVYGTTPGAGLYTRTQCKLPAGNYSDGTGFYSIYSNGCGYVE